MRNRELVSKDQFISEAAQKSIDYWNRVYMPLAETKATPELIYNMAMIRGGIEVPITDSNPAGFVLDEENSDVFMNLCLYFAGRPGRYDLSKGIALIGGVGCGKTKLLRCFANTPLNPFNEVSARTIASDYSTGGLELIEKYFGMAHRNNKPFGLMIDDIGTEIIGRYFGVDLNTIELVILNRYDSLSLSNKTHFATNMNISQIEEKYGARVRSRIRERFNWISFSPNTKDRRG